MPLSSSALCTRRCTNFHVQTETPAILATIARYAPSIDQDLSLMGQHPLEAAKILEWLCWLSGTVHGHAFGGKLFPIQSFLHY